MKKVILLALLALSSFNAAATGCAEFAKIVDIEVGVGAFAEDVAAAEKIKNRRMELNEVWGFFVRDILDDITRGEDENTSIMWKRLREAVEEVCKGQSPDAEISQLLK